VLQSFADPDTEKVWRRERVTKFHPELQRIAQRKLFLLNAAASLADLRVPPGNRLEKLSGDREGRYSIRINGQWKICFRWSDSGPREISITDYH
jgi:toxin HigB-1